MSAFNVLLVMMRKKRMANETWQPISTAPSDRRILVGYCGLNRGVAFIYEARLASKMPEHMGGGFKPWAYKEEPNVWLDIDCWSVD
jgi:hypothetical protein